MNRRNLFKVLGIGAAAAVVAPNVLAEIKLETCPQSNGGDITLDGLTIYEEPKRGYDYSIGVDVGNGLNTPSCISVMRKGKGNEPDVQAAEFSSGTHTHVSLVPVIAAIAEKYRSTCIDPRGPLLVIEQIGSCGDVTQNQLKILGFTRFYKFVQYRESKPPIAKDGWHSTALSRPIITARFSEAVNNGWYQPRSSYLTGNTEKVRGIPRFMAAALSYIGLRGVGSRNV